MCVPHRWRLRLGAAALFACLLAPASLAEDPPPDDEAAQDEPQVEIVGDEEAKELAKELGKAARRRKLEDVLPVLDRVGLRSHESFVKPLLKMLTHEQSKVADRAADILAVQQVEDEKERAKLAKTIWKEGWSDRKNRGRYTVQGRTLVAAVKLEGGGELDEKRFGDVDRMWRAIVGDPQEAWADALISVCEYVRLTKDKRLCRLLAEEIDEPIATAVDAPSNPPKEWWERRWKMWRPVKAEAVEALEVLTGQSFKDTASAKAWFQENEKDFGFRW